MPKKKKIIDFRINNKSPYKTFKLPLKKILLNRQLLLPTISNLVFDLNDFPINSLDYSYSGTITHSIYHSLLGSFCIVLKH